MKVLPRMFFRKGFLMKHISLSRGANSGLRRVPWSEAALVVIGAALAMHASTQRALPTWLLDGQWKSQMVANCRGTPGCIGLTVTPVRTSWLGYRWQLAVQTSTGTSSQVEASLRAARMRLRPIIMTSLAFVFGVLPLAISTGAGAASRQAIGTAVVGGMLSATFLAIFFVPLFYVLVMRLSQRKPDKTNKEENPS